MDKMYCMPSTLNFGIRLLTVATRLYGSRGFAITHMGSLQPLRETFIGRDRTTTLSFFILFIYLFFLHPRIKVYLFQTTNCL